MQQTELSLCAALFNFSLKERLFIERATVRIANNEVFHSEYLIFENKFLVLQNMSATNWGLSVPSRYHKETIFCQDCHHFDSDCFTSQIPAHCCVVVLI